MKNSIILVALFCLGFIHQSNAQGCVAIRTVGGLCTMEHAGMHQEDSSKWTLNINYRYFTSYKHFNGRDEQKFRVEEGSEVINYMSAMDFNLLRNINSKWMVGINIPLVNYDRTSKYEHLGNTSPYRFATAARGLGDIRLAAYRWLIAPDANKKGNLMAGLGIKLPTGNFKAQDEFQYATNARRIGYVDQSIQPGAGGFGVTVELNGFRQINTTWSAYANAFYLLNPRDNNGVSTARGGTPSATAIKYTSNVMSVADQYMVRSGFNYSKQAWAYSLGLRYECIPTYDLIGKSTGFRRPGNILSAEPGVTYMYKKYNFFLYTPVAIRRERPQSYPDIVRTNLTGVFARGDAAFADYSINVGMSFRF
jgi:hypothetical protein